MMARLHIQAAARDGITYLKQGYGTSPFKIANITENKKSGPLHLMLMCSSPGVLDGDDYQCKIEVLENSKLYLHTQSYQRLFNMKKGAQQSMEVHIQERASLQYIPHPIVPHTLSVFTTRNKLYLQNNSRLLWGEILTCGRKLNGEQFGFSKFHSMTDVFVNGRLVIRENFLVQPAVTDVQAIGQWEGYSHQASLIVVDTVAVITAINEIIYNYLLPVNEIAFGISTVANAGLIIRILGHKAEQLYNCLQAIAALVNTLNTMSCKPVPVYAD